MPRRWLVVLALAGCGDPGLQDVRRWDKESSLSPDSSPRAECLSLPFPDPPRFEVPVAPGGKCSDTWAQPAKRAGRDALAIPFGFRESPACISRRWTGQRRVQACRSDFFRGCGEWIETVRFDAEGRKLRETSPHRDLISQFEAGNLVRQERFTRDVYASFVGGYSGNHLAHSRSFSVTRDASACLDQSTQTVFNEWGAPAFVRIVGAPEHERGGEFTYDAQRRLEKRWYQDARIFHPSAVREPVHETFEYGPAGVSRSRFNQWPVSRDTHYDELGRPVRMEWGHSGGGGSFTYEYGPHGTRRIVALVDSAGKFETVTQRDWTDKGQLALEWRLEHAFDYVANEWTTAGIASRRTSSCDGLLLLEELDLDQDGVAERRVEYARDAAGTLLAQVTWQGDERVALVQHSYDCD